MVLLLKIFHVVACFFLILVVLLQQGKGGGLGGMGGGGGQQVFGGSGAGNLLTRLTTISAAIFIATSMTLAYKASAGDAKLKGNADDPFGVETVEVPSDPPPAASSK